MLRKSACVSSLSPLSLSLSLPLSLPLALPPSLTACLPCRPAPPWVCPWPARSRPSCPAARRRVRRPAPAPASRCRRVWSRRPPEPASRPARPVGPPPPALGSSPARRPVSPSAADRAVLDAIGGRDLLCGLCFWWLKVVRLHRQTLRVRIYICVYVLPRVVLFIVILVCNTMMHWPS